MSSADNEKPMWDKIPVWILKTLRLVRRPPFAIQHTNLQFATNEKTSLYNMVTKKLHPACRTAVFNKVIMPTQQQKNKILQYELTKQ